jgi:4-amino-4-deoxy-L-arabinose transferase-like glycosyltransferase
VSATSPATPPARRVSPLALVLAGSLALSLLIALKLPLLDPDEGRNAEVAREMAVGGDLVIPHLAGMPYLDKPPGFFWAASLSIRAFGHTPLAARLPSILASLLTLWLVARAAQRAGGTRFAMIGVALLACAPLFAGLSAYVIFDMLLTLCVTVVWLGVAAEVEAQESAASARGATDARVIRMRRLAMFLAIAAGILIKGPVMLAWALGGSLGAALVLRSRAPLRWLAWWPGWIVALGLPGAWFAAASARFPEYPHYAFLEESLERLTSNSFHRQQGWWFVPAVLVGGTLPWSLASPWSKSHWSGAAPEMKSTARVGLGFVLFAVVFFSISHSKLVTYLLPALPPLAWTAAAMWSERPVRGARAVALAAVLAFTPLMVCVGLPLAYEPLFAGSGLSLAQIVAAAGGPPTLYERCYSPGTEFLLGRTSRLVSERGEETTSNYMVRYRDVLVARGEWRALDGVPPDFEGYLVRSVRDSTPAPSGAGRHEFSRRFIAYHLGAPADSAAGH